MLNEREGLYQEVLIGDSRITMWGERSIHES
jgi:hypothetical protein